MNELITLTPTTFEELEILFEFQLDEEARYLAAFTSNETLDKTSYITKYSKFLADSTINMKTIRLNDKVIGSIAKYETEGEAEITYGIDKHSWGQGITTASLKAFLKLEPIRPIYGRTAFDNYASQKVLEKCGFVRIGSDTGFANARQA